MAPKYFFITMIMVFSLNASALFSDFVNLTDTILVKGDYFYPPFEFINENGEPDGFNVHLFKLLAEEIGINYKLELEPWSKVRDELETGQIDVILGLMVSDERAKHIKFGIPHSVMTHGVFSRKENSFQTLEELRGKEILVQNKDRMHDYLLESDITDKIIPVENMVQALQMLAEGKHHAALIGNFQGHHVINKYKLNNLNVSSSSIAPQPYAMAVSKDNDELLWLLNMGLYHLKTNGSYDKLYDEWFGIYENYHLFKKYKLAIVAVTALIILLAIFIVVLRIQVRKESNKYKSTNQKLQVLVEQLEIKNAEHVLIEKELIKAKEMAEESDNLKSSFLANMSHEIRTPMNSIMGFASLLPDEESKDLLTNYAQIIVRNSEQLVNIIDDIVLYSRLQTKLVSFRPTSFNASDLLADIEQSFNLPEFKQRSVTLVVSFPEKSAYLTTDYEKLRQILTNLISNSFKYTPQGTITVTYTLLDKRVRFQVSDTGMGISKKELDKVFDRFFRGANVSNSSIQGTGLGLSIVKELVELIQGRIWVESKPEQKEHDWVTSFFFEIPIDTKRD